MNPQKKKNNFQALIDRARSSGIEGDVRSFLPDSIKSRWQPDIQAADNSDDAATINIYGVVGEDWWTGEGMTAKIVNSVLRKNKGNPVTVNINSPGGDYFEGLAIYNLLKEHDGEITIRIMGMAASAASVIAMAGDEIKIAEAGFLMIHNAWYICVGNQNEMRECADVLAQFDDVMIGIYAKKTGMDRKEIAKMCDDESWIAGPDAIEMGFATSLLDSDNIDVDDSEKSKYNSSLKKVETALAEAGNTRSERRAILKDLTNTPCAIVQKPDQTPCADQTLNDAIASLDKKLTI